MDNLTIFGCALFCIVGLVYFKSPKWSEFWRGLKHFCEDHELANVLIEDRRAARTGSPVAAKPRGAE